MMDEKTVHKFKGGGLEEEKEGKRVVITIQSQK